MNIESLRLSFKDVVSKQKRELKSYASLFCAEQGYYIEDLALFFDDTALLPCLVVEFTPTLHYGEQALKELTAALEKDLNNIVFNYAYNRRYKIGTEDSSIVRSIPRISEHMPQLVTASQN
jgi:hypothetical protein